jgi:hypothetical protein
MVLQRQGAANDPPMEVAFTNLAIERSRIRHLKISYGIAKQTISLPIYLRSLHPQTRPIVRCLLAAGIYRVRSGSPFGLYASRPSSSEPGLYCVCAHPDRHRIEMARVAGPSVEAIGARFEVHVDATAAGCSSASSPRPREPPSRFSRRWRRQNARSHLCPPGGPTKNPTLAFSMSTALTTDRSRRQPAPWTARETPPTTKAGMRALLENSIRRPASAATFSNTDCCYACRC